MFPWAVREASHSPPFNVEYVELILHSYIPSWLGVLDTGENLPPYLCLSSLFYLTSIIRKYSACFPKTLSTLSCEYSSFVGMWANISNFPWSLIHEMLSSDRALQCIAPYYTFDVASPPLPSWELETLLRRRLGTQSASCDLPKSYTTNCCNQYLWSCGSRTDAWP
jgi:hypothetical protein